MYLRKNREIKDLFLKTAAFQKVKKSLNLAIYFNLGVLRARKGAYRL